MVTYEDRPVTRRWVICDVCGHSEIACECGIQFGIKCDVCGKEGCLACLAHDTFWVNGREYYHHRTCKLTKELQKLKDKDNLRIQRASSIAIANMETEHIC